jgi:D-serine deaminase-like pyridoxal phosphate-dependent protein
VIIGHRHVLDTAICLVPSTAAQAVDNNSPKHPMTKPDIRSFLNFEPAGSRIEDLETPVPVIDIATVEGNLMKWQKRCDAAGMANRPHIKTHKIAGLAKYQIALGAKGITVQKLGEAEVMADAGITDMLITFNVVGKGKLDRLAKLARRTGIAVVADHEDVVEGVASAGQSAGRDISVLVECDTGAKRNGVQSPEAAAALAKLIDRTRGVTYGGLMTYARPGTRAAGRTFLIAAREMLVKSGLETKTISTGGSPDMWSDEGLDIVSEYRAGTYIYFDRSLAVRKTCSFEECALKVLTTVVSRPIEERAIIDAGSKALTSDLLGLSGYGIVRELADAQVYDVNEEHGYLDVAAAQRKPGIGELLHIVPNHACPVSNLFDKVVFVEDDRVLGAVRVDARGLVQ